MWIERANYKNIYSFPIRIITVKIDIILWRKSQKQIELQLINAMTDAVDYRRKSHKFWRIYHQSIANISANILDKLTQL